MNTLPNDLVKCFCPLLQAKTYLHLSMSCKRNLILREKRLKEAMRQRFHANRQCYLLNVYYEKAPAILSIAPSGERDGPTITTSMGNICSITYFRNGRKHGLYESWSQIGTPLEKYYRVPGQIQGIVYCYHKSCAHYLYLYDRNEEIIRVSLRDISEKECQRGCKYLQCIQALRRQEQA